MFVATNQTHFSLAIDGFVLDLQVLSFSGREAISQPFTFDLELAGERPAPDLESLLYKPAFLTLRPVGNGIRGLVRSAGQDDSGKRLARYRITLASQLAYLAQCTSQRIFQHLMVPQIVALTLEEHGILIDIYRFQLGIRRPEREYCVQYDESDLQLVQRLCCEEGIHFHFQHNATAHLLVFGDDQTVFPRLAPVTHQQDSGLIADRSTVKRLGARPETRTSRVIRRNYDFEKPRLALESAARDEARPDLEDHNYLGHFVDHERGKHLARRVLERRYSDYRPAEGCSDQSLLLSGHFLPLTARLRAGWNDLWLFTEVIHEGWQPQVLEESIVFDTLASPDDFRQGYRNRFQATSWEAFFRPPLTPPEPRILGTQDAVATGPKGEEIHCDHYGRVKMQFHWDREGQADDSSSCRSRVASNWAGRNYDVIVIPRVGMGVLVIFLEGGPDQPLVIGRLFHRERLVPYELPAHKTRSVFKSLSNPGGGDYNELHIEDRKGQKQIFVHAQRDWDENIGHDQETRVGHQRHDTVEVNSYSESKTEEHRTTHVERKMEVRVSGHLIVANDQHLKTVSGQFVEAGQEIHPSSGLKVVLETGAGLALKGGGSFLKLDASGVTLSGANIRANSGGSPGSGSGAAPLLPGPPLDVDATTMGQVLDNLARSRSEQKGPEQLIVDVWGDSAQGSQAVLLSPESEA